LALTRTPVLGPRLPPLPTGIPDEIGLWLQNSQRTACENRADMTHLILALVPSATSVARSQRSTSTVLTCSNCTLPQRGIIQFFAYVMYESCVDSALTGSSSRK
jgi:hypothetical protein